MKKTLKKEMKMSSNTIRYYSFNELFQTFFVRTLNGHRVYCAGAPCDRDW